MIHQVRASTQDVDKLGQLVELQLTLMDLAVRESELDCRTIETHLQRRYGTNAEKVADWVSRKRDSLLGNLNAFAAHDNDSEKAEYVAKLREDVELLYEPIPKRLQVAIRKESPGWQRKAGEFCKHFYTLLGKVDGFPSWCFDPPLATDRPYTRWDFVNGFAQANEHLYLCSICDATAYRTQVDSRAYTSIEHFFPKSIYPHLAIHPLNLIPICTACNHIAGDTDLMDYCSERLGIQELLLPYDDVQPGLSQQAYIEIAPRQQFATDRRRHPLEIRFKPASGYESSKLIENFERIYKIEERWNNELHQVERHVYRRMQQFLLGDVQLGNDLTDIDFVIDRTKILMALTSRENLGIDPFGFATVWMLKHFIDSMQREREGSPVYRSLEHWAGQQGETWKALRSHVIELYQRVPGGYEAG